MSSGTPRKARVERETRETRVAVEVCLDGGGGCAVDTGIGMLDHMLEQIARHGLFDLEVSASGDLDRDEHHLVEDVGLCLGAAFDEALGDRAGLVRMGHAVVPMDETLVLAALDLSGRGYATADLKFERDRVGQLPTELVSHFLESFARTARMTLHVRELAGGNDHHRMEAAFKALARALGTAVRRDARAGQDVPSTKGSL